MQNNLSKNISWNVISLVFKNQAGCQQNMNQASPNPDERAPNPRAADP